MLWRNIAVSQWRNGAEALWPCGAVTLCRCGAVALWRCGAVASASFILHCCSSLGCVNDYFTIDSGGYIYIYI